MQAQYIIGSYNHNSCTDQLQLKISVFIFKAAVIMTDTDMEDYKSLMASYKLTEKSCGRIVSDTDLDKIASSHCRKWKSLITHFGMEAIEAEDIDKSSNDEKVKRRNFFYEWKNREGSLATYRKLITSLLAIKCRQDAESVCEMLQKQLFLDIENKGCGWALTETERKQQPSEVVDQNLESSTLHGPTEEISPSGLCSTDTSLVLDPAVHEDLAYQLKRNRNQVMTQFASFVSRLCSRLESRDNVSVRNLCLYLINLPALKSDNKQGLKLLDGVKNELKNADTLTDVFSILSDKCASYLNPDIFLSMLNDYCIDVDCEALRYSEHFKQYINKHNVSEFLKINPKLQEKICEGSKNVCIKFDVEHAIPIAKVVDFKHSVCDILDVQPSALQIIGIKEGCIVVTFLTPVHVAHRILAKCTKLTAKQKEGFQALSVLWLKCEDSKFGFKEEDHHESCNSGNLLPPNDEIRCPEDLPSCNRHNLCPKNPNMNACETLKDVKKAVSCHTADLIPLESLVDLLRDWNIIAVIPPAVPSIRSEDEAVKSKKALTTTFEEPTYFMPCILKCVNAYELIMTGLKDSDPPPLREDWEMISEGLRKNKVQFIARRDKFVTQPKALCVHVRGVIEYTLDTVTSHLNYRFQMQYKFGFECPIHLTSGKSREHICVLAKESKTAIKFVTQPKGLCAHVRGIIESTLDTVTSHLNYKFEFECPIHLTSGKSREHICVLVKESKTTIYMECLQDSKKKEVVPLESRHMVWFPRTVSSFAEVPTTGIVTVESHTVSPDSSPSRSDRITSECTDSVDAETTSDCSHPEHSQVQSEARNSIDCTPTLMELICFPMADSKVNLAEKIGVHYYEFGILLLEDEDGDRISAIEKELGENALDIVRHVFRLWLQGKGRQPVTWASLVAVLQDIGLAKLARDIESVKLLY